MRCFVTYAVLLTVLGVGTPVVAHAGMFGWIDEMFTFREDQKERVAPRRMLPPKEVYVPTYNEADHAAWSQHYTRADLQAEDYLTGSGSKVMRAPEVPVPNVNTYGVAASAPPDGSGGWPMIEQQAAENAYEANRNIIIGDPETMTEQRYDSGPSDGLGIGTRVGPPVRDWNEGPTDGYNEMSRPGDFDYKTQVGNPRNGPVLDHALVEVPGKLGLAGRGAPLDDDSRVYGGGVTIHSDGNAEAGVGGIGMGDGRYVARNARGQVTKYKVQRGDTLSGIAGQEAIYDNWKLWPLIYSANRKAIGRDPTDLDVGSRLGIPRGYSAKQAREAERKAGRGE